jgi:hypothetical protein
MADAFFAIALVLLALLCQCAAVVFRRRRFFPFLLLPGAAFIIAFAIWEHDAVLLCGQIIAAAVLFMLIRPRNTP